MANPSQMPEGLKRPSVGVLLKNLGFLLANVPFAARKAEFHLTTAIGTARKYGLTSHLSLSLMALGQVNKGRKRREQARKSLIEAEGLFERSGAEVHLRQVREMLAGLGAR